MPLYTIIDGVTKKLRRLDTRQTTNLSSSTSTNYTSTASYYTCVNGVSKLLLDPIDDVDHVELSIESDCYYRTATKTNGTVTTGAAVFTNVLSNYSGKMSLVASGNQFRLTTYGGYGVGISARAYLVFKDGLRRSIAYSENLQNKLTLYATFQKGFNTTVDSERAWTSAVYYPNTEGNAYTSVSVPSGQTTTSIAFSPYPAKTTDIGNVRLFAQNVGYNTVFGYLTFSSAVWNGKSLSVQVVNRLT